ncbi:protein FAR1-RELATED SEQUENCE 5-like [Senna tora]|uniref:Protein FAR1-RELATED SEQUENCE 5-like n=1 Tax=Senna tora TaxID=362788 RepID=A0A834XGM0_9FABA|nr:protein FAR1-RELATED SEQUENCE 5-like [Senna tora]
MYCTQKEKPRAYTIFEQGRRRSRTLRTSKKAEHALATNENPIHDQSVAILFPVFLSAYSIFSRHLYVILFPLFHMFLLCCVVFIVVTLMDTSISTSSSLLNNEISAELPLENEVTETDLTPYVGMKFETEEHAYRVYNAYAGLIGFSIRRDWVNKSRMDQNTLISQKFVCFKEGFKKISNCEAKKTQITITKKISTAQAAKIELANNSGIQQKLIFEFLSRQVGGRENVGYTLKDVSNHLTSMRMTKIKEGEAYSLLDYFQSRKSENPSFFYEIQLDVEDEITNIFWADAKMIVDYVCFGDVVSFDTTYCTNKNCRPFAPFVGFNHHRQTIIFGATLLYDETVESFEWLFKTFLKAMCENKPKTIFTDQDAAMAKAISVVLLESYHRLCTWHLFQNALKNVNHAFKKSDSFASDLRRCIYDYEYEDNFLNAWKSILDKHDLRQNMWMQDLFRKKEKWASVYGRYTFSAGATSTQLSESLNGRLRGYMKSTFNVFDFFKNFERLLKDMRYKEIEAKYDMSQKKPPLSLDILLVKPA